MALLDPTPPFSGQQQNIAGALIGGAVPATSLGQATVGPTIGGQQGIAQLLAQISGGTTGAGTSAGFDVQSLLQSLGLSTAQGGVAGVGGAAGTLTTAGTSGIATAEQLFGQGVTTEATGLLPPSAH